MVLGESRCELPRSEDEELTDDQQRDRSRPVIETFLKGHYQSTLTTLPFDEVLSIAETDSEAVLILGKELEGFQEGAPFKLKLVSFNGKSLNQVEGELGDARAILRGPSDGLWLLDATSLRPLSGSGTALSLPADCEYPSAWFQGEHAWLNCTSGVYTTDPGQELIELPQATEECEELQPRPDYAVRGIYKRSSEVSGCSKRQRSPFTPKGKQSGKPLPYKIDVDW